MSFRGNAAEVDRTQDLMRMTPENSGQAIDIGCRDGHFAKLFADKYASVTALDLEAPSIQSKNILCVKGDVTSLVFENNSYDFVFCAEVLEHISPLMLDQACLELGRITKHYLLIGVPYKQDTRVGRTTCYTCGGINPPWGHVNCFDEKRLMQMFPEFDAHEVSFVGTIKAKTNPVSTMLLDWAGNPYGTYSQDEPCVHCGEELLAPPDRSFAQKVATKLAFWGNALHRPFVKDCPKWVHILFKRIDRE